jgi:hypothetical protein
MTALTVSPPPPETADVISASETQCLITRVQVVSTDCRRTGVFAVVRRGRIEGKSDEVRARAAVESVLDERHFSNEPSATTRSKKRRCLPSECDEPFSDTFDPSSEQLLSLFTLDSFRSSLDESLEGLLDVIVRH